MSQNEEKRNNDENVQTEVIQEEAIGTTIETKPEEIVPLNCDAAFKMYSPEEQQEITELANSIDLKKLDNVMSYGGVVLSTTFDQCGEFLKNERGSQADQEVIKQVIQLSKKAHDTYEDFNLVLKEPNFLQRLLLKISTEAKKSRTKKVQHSAVTNYQLLMELRKSCNNWLEMLKKAWEDIWISAKNDVETGSLLEKYIIAGEMAKGKFDSKLAEIQKQYQETGMQKFSSEYEELKGGYDKFVLRLENLKRSRVMYHLSIGQLALIRKSNENVQTTIHLQVDNSMALMGQQLRNAVLNAKTREVLEGQKAINRLNDELLKEVSKTVGLTAEESERLMYGGFYSVEAAKEAVTAVINSCEAIQKTAEEMLPKMQAETAQLNELIDELKPHVESVKKTLEDKTSTTADVKKLKF